MDLYSYPEDYDVTWMASDRNGHVAFFRTGGYGPIPLAAMSRQLPDFGDMEELASSLPVNSKAKTQHDLKELIEITERGFFYYDWRHIEGVGFKHTYDLIGTPSLSIHIETLPSDMRQAAKAVIFDDLDFGAPRLDVGHRFECQVGRLARD